MRANATSRLKWEYDGKSSQTATWKNHVFTISLDMLDEQGKRWRLTTWEEGREAQTKVMIFKSDALSAVYQHAERLVGELAQFMDIADVLSKQDKHALDLEMHIFDGTPPEFRTGPEVVESIRDAADSLRQAAVWLYSAPLSKEKLPIVEVLARDLKATADDTEKRLIEIEWSLKE